MDFSRKILPRRTRAEAGQVVLITCALAGVGRATAFAFAREGAKVVVSGRCAETGDLLALELRAIGADSIFIRADLRIESEVDELVDGAVAVFGHIDVAVNNRDTEGSLGAIVEQTVAGYSATFDANVLSTLLCMKYELRVLYRQKYGCVINTSSIIGRKVGANASLYAASKQAIEGLTKVAAIEAAAHGVRVNAVAPGPVEAGMLSRFAPGTEQEGIRSIGVNSKRIRLLEDVADAILFISSNRARFITGQVMGVDGR